MSDAIFEANSWASGIEDVMRKYLSLEGDDLFSAVHTFEAHAYKSLPPYRDRTNDVKGLDALETALRKLTPVLEAVSTPSIMTLMAHFMHSGEYSEKDGERLAGSLLALTQDRDRLLAGIDASRKALDENDPLIRRSLKTLNVEAVQIVDAAIKVWDKHQDRPAPRKALNGGHSFGKFIGDLFYACDVEGDPKSAFRAWAQTYGAAT